MNTQTHNIKEMVMKRLALVLVALFVIVAVKAQADDSTFIRVTKVDGLWNTDTLRAGDTARFYVMVGNRSSKNYNFSNGFKFYSRASKDDGAPGSGTAMWPSVYTAGVPGRVNFVATRPRIGPLLDTTGFLSKANFGAVLSFNCFSCDGQGSDTVGISGAANDPSQTAIAPTDSGVAFKFAIVTRKEDAGKAICFDSTTNYPPTLTWKWAPFNQLPGTPNAFPDWSGPHCYWLYDSTATTNHAPVLAPIGSQSVNENSPLVMVINATDQDGTTPSFTASPLPTGASFVDNTNGSAQFSWTPTFAQAGIYEVTFIATDGQLSDTEKVQITVNNVNRPPVLNAIGPKNVAENSILAFTVTGSDPDGDALTFGATPLPTGATFNTSTGAFTWTPDFTQAGSYDVTFSVTDGSAPVTEVVTITVTNTNRVPVLAAIGPKNVTVGNVLNFNVSGSDPDGTTPSLSASALTNATFTDNGNGTGGFSFTPDVSQIGAHNVTFVASDGSASDTEIVVITVTGATNQPPVLTTIGPKSVAEGSNLNFGVSATDPDGNLLTFFATPLPAGAAFDADTHIFDWTPGYDQAGTHEVLFVVTDGSAADSEMVTITVTNTNRPPVLAAIGPKGISVGNTLNFNVNATDADGSIPSLTASALTNATFTDNGNGTGAFSFTPDASQIGAHNVTFVAFDGTAADTEIVVITVSGAQNLAPVLDPIGPKVVAEGDTLQFFVSGTDPNGDILTFSAAPLPTHASFQVGAKSFYFTPDYSQAGTYNVLFVVTDGALADSEVVEITVTNTNRAPILSAIGPKSVQVGSTLVFNVGATDPDGTFPALTATSLANATLTDNGDGTGGYSFTPVISQVGAHNVTFYANDGSLADSEVVTITVTAVACPQIHVSKTAYYDTLFVGEFAGAGDTIDVTSSGSQLNWSIAPATGFSFAASSGSTPGKISFSYSELFMIDGQFQRCFTVTGSSPIPEDTCTSTAQVCVNVVVLKQACMSIRTTDSLLSFTAVQGDAIAAPFQRLFRVFSSDSTRSFSFEVKAPVGNNWVFFDTVGSAQTFAGSTPMNVPVQVRPSGLAVGYHSVDIVVMSTDSNVCDPKVKVITVGVTVTRQASADTVLVENKPAVPGQTVSVPVNFVNSCQLEYGELNLSFNPAALHLSAVTYGGSRVDYVTDKTETIDNGAGKVRLTFTTSDQNDVPFGFGNWATLVFVVRPEASLGVYPLTLGQVPDSVLNPWFKRDCDGVEDSQPEFVPGGVVVDSLTNSVCGYVVDPNGVEIPGATVQLWGNFPVGSPEMTTSASSIGSFFFEGVTSVPFDLYAYANGFYPNKVEDLNFNAKGVKIVLSPLGQITPTSQWVDYYCNENTYSGAALPVGSVVEAKTPGNLLVGRFVVTTAGKYGFMPVYRANSDFGDDGAHTGDVISLFVNGLPALATGNTTYPADYAQVQVCVEFGATVVKECTLQEGWNLVSWNVQTETSSITDVLGPYMNCIEVILGFEQGGLTYDPALAEFSTLWNVDHLSGYWIKVKTGCSVTLALEGIPVPIATPIPVTAGWNLVSYLPPWTNNPAFALQSIYDKLLFAYGWNNGIEVFQPGSQFNTLTSMRTCNGYWLKITAGGTLVYPETDAVAGWTAPRVIATADQSLSSSDFTTPTWVNIYAHDLRVDGHSVASGSTVEAFSVETNAKIGSYTMKSDGKFGFMPVYADAAGPNLKPGEQFYLTVDGSKTNETFTWTSNGDRIEVAALTSANSSGTLPDGYSLEQNYPNPFNPTTTISFSVPANTRARVEIYNVLGALIAVPFDDAVQAGEHQVVWDGRNQNGEPVASGIYLYKLVSDRYSEARKMMLLK